MRKIGVDATNSSSSAGRPLDFSAWGVLLVSPCCGLAGGLLEVAARVVPRWLGITHRFYDLSRHFIWLVPITNLLLFSAIGVLLAAATKVWPRRGGWLSTRILCGLTVLPMLIVGGPRVYAEAWLFLSLGMASVLVPALERHVMGLRRALVIAVPCMVGIVCVLAAIALGREPFMQWREAGRPLPEKTAPNVLLIVLDTVRADHMSLYGYHRATTPNLERLARTGIRFDEARSTAPWTLASHASMFTGRWPHELGIKWMTAFGGNSPTLAEVLRSQGYETGGFVANTLYCSWDSGLDRGFTHYEDYDLERLGPFRTAQLVDIGLKTMAALVEKFSEKIDAGVFGPLQRRVLGQLKIGDKKHARLVNREFIGWLSSRSEPDRPFFAFLNYFDAHVPYLLPPGAEYRFGLKPLSLIDFQLFRGWNDVDKTRLPHRYRSLIVDCYDSCLGDLDARLGELFELLKMRGVLDRTLVIVTADHGEGLGEHDLFDHGESLYRTEIRVPLLVVLPENRRHSAVVTETVSLRDLPATITDLVGLASGASFPGHSLATLWRTREGVVSGREEDAFSELDASNPASPNQGRSPAASGSLVALARGEFVYIRNQRDGSEQLFNERHDPRELTNTSYSDAMIPVLERFRSRLDQLGIRPSAVRK